MLSFKQMCQLNAMKTYSEYIYIYANAKEL